MEKNSAVVGLTPDGVLHYLGNGEAAAREKCSLRLRLNMAEKEGVSINFS